MNKILFLFLLVAGISFNANAEVIKLQDFNRLKISGIFNVEVVYGEQKSISFEGEHPEFDVEKFEITYKGKELSIKYPGASLKNFNINIVIKTDELNYIEARNGVEIKIDEKIQFPDDMLELFASFGGKMVVTSDKTPWIKAKILQGGSIRIIGETDLAEFTIKTGGTIGASFLNAQKINAEVVMGGDIICNPLEILNANVSAGGNIYYKTEPNRLNKNVSLGGKIEKIDG